MQLSSTSARSGSCSDSEGALRYVILGCQVVKQGLGFLGSVFWCIACVGECGELGMRQAGVVNLLNLVAFVVRDRVGIHNSW